jgi:hypothetical protein
VRPVVCESTICSVKCKGPENFDGPCNGNVTCVAEDSCLVTCDSPNACGLSKVTANAGLADVRCTSTNACERVTAVGRTGANVTCHGANACYRGVSASSPDSGIACVGANACDGAGAVVVCDGGACRAACGDSLADIAFCCAATTCVPKDGTNCHFTPNGCP